VFCFTFWLGGILVCWGKRVCGGFGGEKGEGGGGGGELQ